MRFNAISLAAAGLLACAAPVSAHVTVSPATAVTGAYAELIFAVPHDCEGSPTVALRVKIPEGVTAVKAQFKPGWAVVVKNRKLDVPLKGDHGATVTETIDEVEWRGGPLPGHLYDTFGLRLKLADAPGKTLFFPAVQECQQGVRRWIEIPAAGQSSHALKDPAPAVSLTPKSP